VKIILRFVSGKKFPGRYARPGSWMNPQEKVPEIGYAEKISEARKSIEGKRLRNY